MCHAAIDLYRRYLKANPAAADRVTVEQTIDVLERFAESIGAPPPR